MHLELAGESQMPICFTKERNEAVIFWLARKEINRG